MKPDIGDDDYLSRMDSRYNEILNMLYILGLASVVMITIIVVYSFSLYNFLLEEKHDFFGIEEEIKSKNNNT